MQVVTPIRLAIGSRLLVTRDMLAANDSDSPDEEIVFHVLTPTLSEVGHFKMRNTRQNVTSFTQHDINNNLVLFVQQGQTSTTEYKFNITVTNHGGNPVAGLRTTVLLQVGEAQLFLNTQGLSVNFQQATRLTPADLPASTSFDNQKPRPKVRFFVTAPANTGHFAIKVQPDDWRKSDSFSAADISNDRVAFVHIANSRQTKDSVVLKLASGTYESETPHNISLNIKLPFTPVQVSVEVATQQLTGTEGRPFHFTKDTLSLTLEPSLPKNGEMEYFVASLPKHGILLDNTSSPVPVKSNSTAVASENLKKLVYIHDDSETSSDIIQFCVRPVMTSWPLELIPPEVSCNHLVDIRITPVNDEPPQVSKQYWHASRLCVV